MSKRRHLSPLRYPGGKARMSAYMADIFEAQTGFMDIEVWVEPFAGGAGVALGMLESRAVSEAWLFETNPAIAALWSTIVTDGERFAARVETTTPDMQLWGWATDTIANPDKVSRFDLAFAALIVNRCSRSGMVRPDVGPIGGASQTGRWTISARWNPTGLSDRIRHIATMSNRLRVHQSCGIEGIEELNGAGIEDEVMLFVDPPYLREGNRLYACGMDMPAHQRLADALNTSPARWVLTYDDEPSVADQLYPERRVLAYDIPNTANRARIAREYAVFSDNLTLPVGTPRLLPTGNSHWVRSHFTRSATAQPRCQHGTLDNSRPTQAA